MAQHLRILTTAALWLAGAGLAPAQPATPAASTTPAAANRSASLRLRMLAEEDARSTTPTALLRGLKGDDAELRRVALRALGRFQSPELAAAIVPSLRDPAPPVRTEAANALAQSVFASTSPEEVREAARQLRARLAVEPDPRVRGALALSIGRLRYPSDEAGREAAAVVLDVAFPKGPRGVRVAASPAALANSLRGLYHAALARPLLGTVTRQPGAAPFTWLSDEARETLGSFLVPRLECCLASARVGADQCAECDANRLDPTGPDAQFRRQAVQALAATRQPDALIGLALLRDADEQTRALALRWALEASWMDEPQLGALVARWGQRFGMAPDAARAEVLARAQVAERLVHGDPSPIVRYEGVRTLTPEAMKKRGCAPVLAAMDDPSIAIAGYAMENAHLACAGDPAVLQRLEELTRDLPAAEASAAQRAGGPVTGAASVGDLARAAATRASSADTTPRGWHRFAFALQGYARVDPAAARDRVVAAMRSAAAPIRRYGAVAAGHVLGGTRASATRNLGLTPALAALVDDPDPNVATEAVRALAAHDRAGSRDVFLRALRRDFYELVLEAAQALRPKPDGSGPAGPVPVPPAVPRDNTGASGKVPGTPGSMASVETTGSGTPMTAAVAPGDGDVVPVALDALDRLTRAKRETSRDPRRALVQLIGNEGREADAVRLEPWLRDFDPGIAAEAATGHHCGFARELAHKRSGKLAPRPAQCQRGCPNPTRSRFPGCRCPRTPTSRAWPQRAWC